MKTDQESSTMTAFVCTNCLRSVGQPSSGGSPAALDFAWPAGVRQVLVPCTGRLQPEHVLRAFECGSSIVSVVACRKDSCHYIEGSRRCACRVDYIRSILKEIGLGEDRLLFFHLPGSASENPGSEDLSVLLAEIKECAMHELRVQQPSPLARKLPERTGDQWDE